MRNIIYILIFCFSITSQFLLGQSSPPFDACFSLDKLSKRYCVGEEVKITNCINPPTGSINGSKIAKYYFLKEGVIVDSVTNSSSLDFSYVFTTSGTHKIRQRGGQGLNGSIDDTIITVVIVPKDVKPKFELGACVGSRMNIKFTDGVYTSYFVKIDNNAPILVNSLDTTFTFLDNNPKTISITGGECAVSETGTFTPFDQLIVPDVIRQVAEADILGTSKNANIILNGSNTMRYELAEYAMGSWQAIDTITGNNGNFSIKPSLKPSTNYFRVSSVDACGNARRSIALIIPELRVGANNNENVLNWSAIDPSFLNEVSDIEILRNGSVLATIAKDATNYTDVNVICARKYEYSIRVRMNTTNSANNNISSTNIPVSVVAKSNNKPPAITAINASVVGKNITLTWDLPNSSVSFYDIKRSEDNTVFKLLDDKSFNNIFIDNTSLPSTRQYCYLISYKDSCGNFSDDSIKTCSIFLNTVKTNDDEHINNWTKYMNHRGNNHTYIIEIFDQNNKLINTVNISDSTFTNTDVLLDKPMYRYRVKAIEPTSPNVFYFSNVTEIKNDILIFVPDAFTPNVDGTNDIFEAKGKYFRDFKMTVFNRWGEAIFYSESNTIGWNGEYNGYPAMAGLYTYVITAIDNNNQPYSKKGIFYLIR